MDFIEEQRAALEDAYSHVNVPATAIHDFLNLLLMLDHFEQAADLNAKYAILLLSRHEDAENYNDEFLGAIASVYFVRHSGPVTLDMRADREGKIAAICDFLTRYAAELAK